MSFLRLCVSCLAIALVQLPFGAAPAVAQVTSIDSHSAEAAIISAYRRAPEIARIKNVPSLGVIDLSFNASVRFRSNLPDVAEFRHSAEQNAAGINALRKALSKNPATRAALAQHGIAVGRVVGVDIGSTGSLRVYVL
jgi:hypothetical protein